MNTRTVCRICKTEGVRLHCITNTYLQEIYEHDTGTLLTTDDIKPLLACITCCNRLQHCYEARTNCEQRENVLTMMVNDDEQYSNTNMAAMSPVEYQNNTCVLSDVQKSIKIEPEQLSEVIVKEELTIPVADEICQENYESIEDNESAKIGLLPKIVRVKCEKSIMDEMGSNEITNVNIASHDVVRDPCLKYLEGGNDIQRSSKQDHSLNKSTHDIPLKKIKIVLHRCDSMIYKKHESRRATQSKPYEDISGNKNESTQPKFYNNKNDELKLIITKAGINLYNCTPVKCKASPKQYKPIKSCASPDNQPLECNFCNKRFKYKTPLINHIRIHTGEKPFKCNICSKRYGQKCHLNRHNYIHSGEQTFKCNNCKKRFTQKSSLIRHIGTHTGVKLHKRGDKPYKCNICNTTFNRKYDLFNHHRIHTGEKPYKCNICSMCFSAQSNLVAHIRTHTGLKPYKCNICHNTFSRKNGLLKHNGVHTGDKPFKCDICNKFFTRKFSLDSHIRLHNAESPDKCDNCGKCFTQKSHLAVHLRGKCKSKKI